MAQKAERLYTYEEFEAHSKTQRSEWIDGMIYDMSDASLNHGRVFRRLGTALDLYLDGKPCELFNDDVEVVFLEGSTHLGAVQPDLKVVCEREKLQKNAIIGAPTLIVEVVSPSSVSLDFILKRKLYECNRVPEYWIVSPMDRKITICVWVDGMYIDQVIASGTATSTCFPDFSIELATLFANLD